MPAKSLTDEQCQEALDAYALHGSEPAASLALGISRGAFQNRLRAARLRLALKSRDGHAPGHFDSGVAPGYLMGKVTVQRGSDGSVERTWERQSPDAVEARRALEVAAEAMTAELPRIAPVEPPAASDGHLCTVYTLTDAHIGMLAWHREGGDDWDLGIAERTIVGCFAELIRAAPASELAVFNQLGDLLHYDSLQSVTPTSGHLLDADGRFTKMVEVAVRVIRRVVAMLLEKHPRVHMILAEGNHDIASSVWLRTMFKALYEDEPRIAVDDSALPYYALQWGDTMLAFHHSHLKKLDRLAGFMAAQFPVIWGATKKRYVHTGDKHHAHEKDDGGAKVIQHPTLAARDAYAARGGWHAMRAANAITYHKAFGEVARNQVCPEMLDTAA